MSTWNMPPGTSTADIPGQEDAPTMAPLTPVALTDERIDLIADIIVKGMPDGIHGFCKTWGWRQFARAILQDCAGHYAQSEIERLKAEAAKSERRAVAFGDIISNHCIAMQSALIEFYVGEGSVPAITWIENTLCGPGLLPDYKAAQALGGAQAWFDAKTAEHEAFRAEHPAP